MGNGVTKTAPGALPPSGVSAAKATLPVVAIEIESKAPPPMASTSTNPKDHAPLDAPLPAAKKTVKVVTMTNDKTVKVVSNDASNSHKLKADAFKAQGNQLFADGNDVGAAEAYTKAIGLDPENHVLYSNRSGAYLRAGKVTEALSDALCCIDHCVGWAKGYNRKGAALHALGRLHDAACAYKDGLIIEPQNAKLKDALSLVEGLIKKKRAKEERRQHLATKKDSKLTTAGGKERRRVAGRARTVGQQATPPPQARQPQRRQPQRRQPQRRQPRQQQPRASATTRAQKQTKQTQPPPPKNTPPKQKLTVRKRVAIPGGKRGADDGDGENKPKRPARRLPQAQKRGEISRAKKTEAAAVAAVSTNDIRAVSPTTSKSGAIVVGAKVRVHGLKGAINGTEGVAQKLIPAKSKWMVRLDGRNRPLPISAAHLEKV